MSRFAQVLGIFAICGLAVGCVPIPRKVVARYGVEGRLVDQANGMPVSKIQAAIVVDGQEFKRVTNRYGEFKVKPDMHHFWTWLGGPMWVSATRASVEISLRDYAPYRKTFVVKSESPDAAVPDKDRLSGNYICIGDIEMQRSKQ